MPRKLTDEQIIEIADGLMGTCRPIDDVLPAGVDFYCLDGSDFFELDRLVMNCAFCGRWDRPDRIDDDGTCFDCTSIKEGTPI